jgi:pimeloyl-ACP methyl ester carboxylesterase
MSAIRQATVSGASVAYRDEGHGAPILLMHSGFVADSMLPLLSQPAMRSYRKIAYHRRGYGHSERTSGPRSMRDAADEGLGLLDVLGIDRAHLVGHSMGAVVAIEMALTEPQRVASLTLMEPLVGFLLTPDAAAFVADAAQVALPRFASGDPAGALDAWLTGAFGPGFREVLDRNLPGAWDQAINDAEAAFGVELNALQQWSVGPADLERISVPTLSLLHVGDDWIGFGQIHEGLLGRVPGCREATVDLGSHLLQIADARLVAEAVAPFIADHSVDSDLS